jgi:hypothetical protein
MSEKRIYNGEEYYPEDQLPEVARGWCRYYVGSIYEYSGTDEQKLELWKTGTHRFFVLHHLTNKSKKV